MGKLTIVGLGPGNADLLTLGAVKAMQETSCLLLRTGRHPTVAELERLGLSFLTYDEVYETESSFEAVYQTITVDVLRRASNRTCCYASLQSSSGVGRQADADGTLWRRLSS